MVEAVAAAATVLVECRGQVAAAGDLQIAQCVAEHWQR